METVALQYVGGSEAVYLPNLGIEAKLGEAVEVPADLAGHAPGDWHELAEGDEEWWPRRLGEDGSTVETYDPGLGLLAQHEVWILAPSETPATPAEPIHDTPQEG